MMSRDKDFYKRVNDKNFILTECETINSNNGSESSLVRHSYFRETIPDTSRSTDNIVGRSNLFVSKKITNADFYDFDLPTARVTDFS